MKLRVRRGVNEVQKIKGVSLQIGQTTPKIADLMKK